MDELQLMMQVMLPAAQAAYSVTSVPTPNLVLGAGYTSVGLIMADPWKAIPAMAQATPDAQRVAQKMVIESSIFGLVAWNAAENSSHCGDSGDGGLAGLAGGSGCPGGSGSVGSERGAGAYGISAGV